MGGHPTTTSPPLPGQPSRPGFTLMEALIALAIISLVAVLVLDAVRLAASGSARIEHFVQRELDNRLDMLALRDIISSTAVEHTGTERAFTGSRTQISGFTTRPAAGTGAAFYTLSLRQDDTGMALIYREGHANDPEPLEWTVERWTGAHAARFEYLRSRSDGWNEIWPEPPPAMGLRRVSTSTLPYCAHPPAAVRLTVQDDEGERAMIIGLYPTACPPPRLHDLVE